MDVTMPQLGETVTEGTITKWFKQVGDTIKADEPLFEVSTDKVDSEVPAPTSGVVSEILVQEGEKVAVGVRLAVIGDSDGMVKIVAERDGPLLGVHIVGPWATELIAEGYLSVNWEATAADLGLLIHAHPSLSELFGESALALTGRSLHG